jgi:hypothetical protein
MRAAAEPQAGDEKPVWRLAFFSRLEERKGLKLFVEAVAALDAAALDARFEVHFVGAESRIDMLPSGAWLRERTAAWTFPVRPVGAKTYPTLTPSKTDPTTLPAWFQSPAPSGLVAR